MYYKSEIADLFSESKKEPEPIRWKH